MYSDPRYPQLPMTQADWSGLLQGAPQPAASANTIPDNVALPRPVINAPTAQAPTYNSAPNYPTPPVRPADLTPSSTPDFWNSDPNGTPSNLNPGGMNLVPPGQANNFSVQTPAMFPTTTALLKGATGTW